MITASTLIPGWRSAGWVHVRRFLGDAQLLNVEGWIDEIERWAEVGGPGLHHYEGTPAGPKLARSEQFLDHPTLREFLVNGPVVELVTMLFGEVACLFKEKVNYKYPGGGGYAPHQDAAAYRFDPAVADIRHISVMVPLDAATVDSGCLWIAEQRTTELLSDDGRGRLAPHVVEALDWHPVEVVPGDVFCFDSLVPHYSEMNRSRHPRRAMYLTYVPATAGDLRDRYYAAKNKVFSATDATFGGARVRLSLSDDFLGVPTEQR